MALGRMSEKRPGTEAWRLTGMGPTNSLQLDWTNFGHVLFGQWSGFYVEAEVW